MCYHSCTWNLPVSLYERKYLIIVFSLRQFDWQSKPFSYNIIVRKLNQIKTQFLPLEESVISRHFATGNIAPMKGFNRFW